MKFGLEAGPLCLVHSSLGLKRAIEAVNSEALRVNYNPANIVLTGYDVVGGIYELGDLIVHTHTKDGKILADGNFLEVGLGEGEVAFSGYIGALEAVGYDGFLTVSVRWVRARLLILSMPSNFWIKFW